MRVNIAVGSSDMNWIAGRLARELVDRLPKYGVDAQVNGKTPADLTYQQIVYGWPDVHPAIGMFTHGDFRPMTYGPAYDGQIALNPVMLQYLKSVGCTKATMIELPVADQFIKRPIVFGVAGRTYADKRKGEHLVAAAIEDGYHVIGWGSGWPCPIASDRLEDLLPFYKSLDYYIDTSSDEGGCVPALECLALGIPVISHVVGVDRPVLAYERHDWSSLQQVMYGLTHPRTYDDWAIDHAEYFMRFR